MNYRSLALLIPMLLAACAQAPATKPATPTPSRDGKVSYEAIPAGKAGSYHMDQGQHSFGAQPITNDPPAYPAELVAKNLAAVEIRAKVIVDAEGKVTDVRDLQPTGTPSHPIFFNATREAAMRWTYTPMTVVQGHEGKNGQYSETRSNEPFSLDYVFRFELKDGKPVVSTSR